MDLNFKNGDIFNYRYILFIYLFHKRCLAAMNSILPLNTDIYVLIIKNIKLFIKNIFALCGVVLHHLIQAWSLLSHH
jgi:hypothetical protein